MLCPEPLVPLLLPSRVLYDTQAIVSRAFPEFSEPFQRTRCQPARQPSMSEGGGEGAHGGPGPSPWGLRWLSVEVSVWELAGQVGELGLGCWVYLASEAHTRTMMAVSSVLILLSYSCLQYH